MLARAFRIECPCCFAGQREWSSQKSELWSILKRKEAGRTREAHTDSFKGLATTFSWGLGFFFNLKNVPLIYFWLCWVFVAQAFSELWRVGATLQLLCVASQCGGFSCCGAQALRHAGFSRCGSWALEQRLNSCGTWAYLLHSMWDPPIPEIEPAMTGRFFTTEPPGKRQGLF